ncbi:MAG: galactokinase [Bdellovibrionaceae bacterium]|nr:galactokinase [Pseudobdellovibrionaceae bacterium]
MRVEVESPMRVDLAGGTLDCWPLYNFVGSCWTVNLAISVYSSVSLNTREDKKISINIKDLSYSKTFESIDELYNCKDKEAQLIIAILRYWEPQKGFDIVTYSQSPVGGGLGGSSSLVISLLKAFCKVLHKEWSLKELVTVGHNIEAQLLHTPTGTQDYIPAVQAGLNLIHYTAEGFNVENIPYDVDYFAQRMSIVYTGRSHNSGINNWQVVKEAVEKDTKTMSALMEIAEVSKDMRQLCLNADWQKLPELFNREFSARVKLSSGFSSPEITNLESIALRHGAEAVKICGAGGGGCVMLWSPPDKKKNLVQAIQEKGFHVLDAKPLKN